MKKIKNFESGMAIQCYYTTYSPSQSIICTAYGCRLPTLPGTCLSSKASIADFSACAQLCTAADQEAYHRLISPIQGVTKRWRKCRLSWLTNSDLVYEPKCGGGGWRRGLSQ
jgi:hypothetical protein